MRILLLLPAAESVRVTNAHQVPDRRMLRFSVLPLTTVAALTPPQHEVLLCDENVEPLDLDADVDVVGISFMTALAPRAFEVAGEFRRRGKVVIAGDIIPRFVPAKRQSTLLLSLLAKRRGFGNSCLRTSSAARSRGFTGMTRPCGRRRFPSRVAICSAPTGGIMPRSTRCKPRAGARTRAATARSRRSITAATATGRSVP